MLSSLEYSISLSTQAALHPCLPKLAAFCFEVAEGDLYIVCGMCKHTVDLQYLKYRSARILQPNQKWLQALRIKPGSLNHEPQPYPMDHSLLIIGCQMLINQINSAMVFQRKESWHEQTNFQLWFNFKTHACTRRIDFRKPQICPTQQIILGPKVILGPRSEMENQHVRLCK